MNNQYQPLENLKVSGNLPSMPQVLVQLIDACHASSPDLQRIAELVEKDATISAKVLQLVNSAYIGSRRSFTDIKQATVFLGTGAVKNLAITVSVQQVFRRVETNGLMSLDRFWYHSFQHAVISEKLAEAIKLPTPGDAYLAGLFHDIGKLLLWMAFPGKYAPLLLKGIRCHDARLTFLEQDKLNINHCDAGAWLCEQWNLPSPIGDAIKYHHHSIDELEQALPLPQVVALADIICHSEPHDNQTIEAAQRLLELPQVKITTIVEETEEVVLQVAETLGIRIPQGNTSSIEKEEESEEVHKETSLGLINRVRDITQLTSTLESLLKSETPDDILLATEQNLKILFNETTSLFLLWTDEQKNKIQAKTSPGNKLGPDLDTFYFTPRANGKSLIEKAITDKKYTHSFQAQDGNTDSPSILDNQLINILSTEGFAAFPLLYKEHLLGLLVIGFSASGFNSLLSHATPLQLLLQHTAIALFLEQRQQIQTQQLLDEKINSASLVARKIAHEINNPVAILQNYTHILRLKTEKNEKIGPELSIIEEELQRISLLTDQLRDLGGENITSNLGAVDLNHAIKTILSLYENTIEEGPDIEFKFTPGTDIPAVQAEKNGLRQVLLNIINNAREAIEISGTIEINTAPMDDMVKLTISDDGPGIKPAALETIFTPGFTTKHKGHSGLGLAITKKLINDMQGEIMCESSANGTIFSILLPTGSI